MNRMWQTTATTAVRPPKTTKLAWRLKKYLVPALKGKLRTSKYWLNSYLHPWRYGKTVRAQLQQILTEHNIRPGVVAVLTTCDWNYPHFQRPQQLALAWSKKKYLVFYCTQNLYDRVAGLKKLADNLYLVSSPALLATVPELTVLIDYAPFLRFTKQLQTRTLIYDFCDETSVHQRLYGKSYSRLLADLLTAADLVVASADALLDQAVGNAQRVILVPNAADGEHFSQGHEQPCPSDLVPIVRRGKPIIGYYGAFDWLDFDLLKFLARREPAFDFVLIGADFEQQYTAHGLHSLHNLFSLGAKDYQQLPAYLARFDVAIIPFRQGTVAQATSPVKLFEYLAAGKPVVTTDMHECRKYPGVLVTTSAEEFLTALHRALELRQQPEFSEHLKMESQKHTWHARVDSVIAALR